MNDNPTNFVRKLAFFIFGTSVIVNSINNSVSTIRDVSPDPAFPVLTGILGIAALLIYIILDSEPRGDKTW